jgi:hypothetical protein
LTAFGRFDHHVLALRLTICSPSISSESWGHHTIERGFTFLALFAGERKIACQRSKLNDAQRQAIARMIESGPIPAGDGVVRWRLIDLVQWIFEEFRAALIPARLQYRSDEPASRRDRRHYPLLLSTHAVLLIDQAGPQMSMRLAAPTNITIIPCRQNLPSSTRWKNVWQLLRDNRLSNRVFKSCDDLVDDCCAAWYRLIDQPVQRPARLRPWS